MIEAARRALRHLPARCADSATQRRRSAAWSRSRLSTRTTSQGWAMRSCGACRGIDSPTNVTARRNRLIATPTASPTLEAAARHRNWWGAGRAVPASTLLWSLGLSWEPSRPMHFTWRATSTWPSTASCCTARSVMPRSDDHQVVRRGGTGRHRCLDAPGRRGGCWRLAAAPGVHDGELDRGVRRARQLAPWHRRRTGEGLAVDGRSIEILEGVPQTRCILVAAGLPAPELESRRVRRSRALPRLR